MTSAAAVQDGLPYMTSLPDCAGLSRDFRASPADSRSPGKLPGFPHISLKNFQLILSAYICFLVIHAVEIL